MADWIEPQPVVVSDALRDAVGGHPLVATSLARRGIITPEAARVFLNSDDYVPAPASSLPDIDLATDRIWRALTDGERVAVWGDFDVDGQTSTALLVEALRKLSAVAGPKQAPRLSYRVPTRDQGHGIFLPDLDELLDRGVTLLVTCDTGVDAFAAIERATERGCEVIVTDHHHLPNRLPPALAMVNPKRLPTGHPLCEIPGVGVAYKLAEHLYEWAGHNLEPDAALDLVALGVVADVATQVADVRYLLQRGLETLRTTTRIGLRALVDQAELRFDGLTEEHIGYQLAPRLNAVGRLGDANRGVELLLTQDLTQARILATEMDGLNYERRLITNQITKAALTQIEHDPSLLDYRALVVAGHKWHPGVLGLVAGRLAEKFQRPAVVLSIVGAGPARGSARSVPGCDIYAGIKRTADLLLRFGGHSGAAGLTLDLENLEAFRKALSRSLDAVWDRAVTSPSLRIDAFVPLEQLSLELVGELERLAPFGPGNPPLRLATRNLRIVADALIGRESEHRRLVVVDEEGTQQTVLWWQGASQSLPEGRFDLAYALRARDYRGETQLQVEWTDARIPGPVAELRSRPTRAIVDWRGEADPQAMLAKLPEENIAVWAEGEKPDVLQKITGADRLNLGRAPALVIWTAPAGPAELAQTIQAVEPDTVYLIAAQPVTGGFGAFTKRLRAMLKHDLRVRDGQVNLSRLAAALGHRETTVRASVEWLEAGGGITIIETIGHTLTVTSPGERSLDLQDAESRLRRMLEETAAYRRHFRMAPVETLGIN